MALISLQNQFISASYGQLVQVSGSALADGNGAYLTSSLLDISASFAERAANANNATSASFATTALTASHLLGGVATASFAETASYSNFAISASIAQLAYNSVEAEDLVIPVKNISGGTLGKGVAVHAVSVTGETINVTTASADDSNAMPAIGLLSGSINNNANGEAIISGRIRNIDTSLLSPGVTVYVNNAGLLTTTKPTGSDLIQNIGICAKVNATEGEIIVLGSGRSNDLPNIANNYIWKGDADGVPQAVLSSSIIPNVSNTASYVAGANVDGTVANATSASHAITADTASFLPNSTRLNITDITASNASFTSASIGYLQSITGSAKIIGDAFIILNNDTPAERYAGVKVLDSGSTDTTASMLWDGQTNDWFYEFSSSGTHEYGVVMMGPEYTTLGSPSYLTANFVPKGNGGHHLENSNINENGGTMNLGTAASPIQFPNIIIQTDSTISAGNMYAAYQITDNGGGFSVQLENTTYSGLDGSNPVMRLRGGANNGTDGNTIISSNTSNGRSIYHKQVDFGSPVTMSAALSGGKADFVVHDTADFVKIDGNEQDALEVIGSVFIGSVNQRQNNPYNSFVHGEFNTIAGGAAGNSAIIGARNSQINGSTNHGLIGGGLDNQLNNGERQAIIGGNDNQINGPENSVIIGGDGNRISNSAYTGSVVIGGKAITAHAADTVFVPDLDVSGSISITGSAVFDPFPLSIASTTASMDCSRANMFSLSLAASVDTHLDATNIQAGQVIQLQLTQNDTTPGTISFADEFKFVDGTAFAASTGVSDIDVLTFVSFDGANILATGLKNFS